MIDRNDVPAWAYNITTWINSQDPQPPESVAANVINLQKRFGLDRDSLAFHYYEWDTLGNKASAWPEDNKCDNDKGICGFDTHYPDYFPARFGFEQALATLKENGLRVIPYINGRIFDTQVSEWTASDAAKRATVKTNHKYLNVTDNAFSMSLV
jgi:hypothetical protein